MKNLKDAAGKSVEKWIESIPDNIPDAEFSVEHEKEMQKLFKAADRKKTVKTAKGSLHIAWVAVLTVILAVITVYGGVLESEQKSESETEIENQNIIPVSAENESNESEQIDKNGSDETVISNADNIKNYSRLYNDPENKQCLTPITYDGEDIVLYYDFYNGEEYIQNGIFFMIDGIRQTIRVEYDGEFSDETQMYIFDADANEEVHLKIYFTPNVGKKGDTVYLSSHTYRYPTYVSAEDMFSSFSPGLNSGMISEMYAVPVYMNDNCTDEVTVVSDSVCVTVENYDEVLIKQKNSAEISEISGDNTTSVEPDDFPSITFYKELDEVLYFRLGSWINDRSIRLDGLENETLSFVLYEDMFYYTGELTGEYRVSFYIDHQLMPVFDGCSYADIVLEKGKQTTVNVQIDSSSLPEYSRCYVILAKLDAENFKSMTYMCRLDTDN